MDKLFNVRFVGERAVFSVSVDAVDDWQARRKAELYFSDGFGFDLGVLRWVDVEIEEVA